LVKSTLLLAIASIGCVLLPGDAFGQGEPTTPKNPTNSTPIRIGLRGAIGPNYLSRDDGDIIGDAAGLNGMWGLMVDANFGTNYAFATGIDVSYYINNLLVRSQLVDLNPAGEPDGEFTEADTFGGQIAKLNGMVYQYRNQYVGIPLTIKFKTNELGYLTYWGQLGIEPSVLIRTLLRTTGDFSQLGGEYVDKTQPDLLNPNRKGDGDDGNAFPRTDFDDNVTPIRLGLVVGAGAEYSLGGNTSVFLGLRYNNGLTDLSRDEDIKYRNSSFQAMVGLFF
jgi:hypothetical protein